MTAGGLAGTGSRTHDPQATAGAAEPQRSAAAPPIAAEGVAEASPGSPASRPPVGLVQGGGRNERIGSPGTEPGQTPEPFSGASTIPTPQTPQPSPGVPYLQVCWDGRSIELPSSRNADPPTMAEIDELCDHPPPPPPPAPPPPEPPRIVRVDSNWRAVACQPGSVITYTAHFNDGSSVSGTTTSRWGENRVPVAHGRVIVFLAHQPGGPGSCAAVLHY